MSKPPSRYALLEMLQRSLAYLEAHETHDSSEELKDLINDILEVVGADE